MVFLAKEEGQGSDVGRRDMKGRASVIMRCMEAFEWKETVVGARFPPLFPGERGRGEKTRPGEKSGGERWGDRAPGGSAARRRTCDELRTKQGWTQNGE